MSPAHQSILDAIANLEDLAASIASAESLFIAGLIATVVTVAVAPRLLRARSSSHRRVPKRASLTY